MKNEQIHDKLVAILDQPLDWDDNHPLDNRNSYSTFRGLICELRDALADALAATSEHSETTAPESAPADAPVAELTRVSEEGKDPFVFRMKPGEHKLVVTGWLRGTITVYAPPPSQSADQVRDALEAAESALARCYNVADWPADGSTSQDEALFKVRAVLATSSAAKGESDN